MPELELPTQAEPQDVSAMEKLLSESHVPEEPKDEIIEEPEATPDPEEQQDKKVEEEKPKEEEPEPPVEKQEEEPEKSEAPEPTEDDFDKKIDKINLRKGATEKSRKALQVLKEAAKTEHKEKIAERTRREEAERQLREANPLTPEMQKEMEELRSFRQSVDIEADPIFNEQFTKQINSYEESALNLLKSWKLPESAAKYIQDNGGVSKFRTSNELMPASFKNSDGSRQTREQWWETTITPNLNSAQREELGDALLAIRQLSRDKSQAIEHAKTNREAFVKQQQEAGKKASQDWINRIQTHAKKVLGQYGEIATLKEMPKNPTPEVKKSVEDHNARYHQAEKIAQKYITEITPENLVESAIGFAYATVAKGELKNVNDQLEKSQAKVKELEQQVKDIKEAGKTSHRQTTVTKTKVAPAPDKNVDAETAMTNLINQQAES